MKAIIIEESVFDHEFEATLDKLRADRFESSDPTARSETSPIGQMHRAFHYEIVKLKERLKERR